MLHSSSPCNNDSQRQKEIEHDRGYSGRALEGHLPGGFLQGVFLPGGVFCPSEPMVRIGGDISHAPGQSPVTAAGRLN